MFPRQTRFVSSLAVGAGALLMSVFAAPLAWAQPCEGEWLPGFAKPGVSFTPDATPPPPWGDFGLRATVVFDDGTGPALYIGGGFHSAGGVDANRPVAKWDGLDWTPLPGLWSGTGCETYALAVFDDGTGPALYAGGHLCLDDGETTTCGLAKWDGTSWSPVGGGIEGANCNVYSTTAVFALAAWDDGTGPALYVGGYFEMAGDEAVNNIAKWDGATWSALDDGVNGTVRVLTVFNGELHAGGSFDMDPGEARDRVARWDGTSWSSVGNGLNNSVYALTVHEGALYAAGDFRDLGDGVPDCVGKLVGGAWLPLGDGITAGYQDVYALGTYADDLYAAGWFSEAGGMSAANIAKWDGANWWPVGTGTNNRIRSLCVWDDGLGAALYAVGYYTSAGGLLVGAVGRWDGGAWSTLGQGLRDRRQAEAPWAETFDIRALAVWNDGMGPALYAGGNLTHAGGVEAENVARWDGSSWSALGAGLDAASPNSYVSALAGGPGGQLYAGGKFVTPAEPAPLRRVARWDGTEWLPLGDGITSPSYAIVNALAYFDGALYAGGDFDTAGGVSTDNIARWDGSIWSAVGGSLNARVRALKVWDDGSGPALYVGGSFNSAGGVPVLKVAKWDGAEWSALGTGIGSYGEVRALETYDDGTGPALYAGGMFSGTEEVPLADLAKWDGATWSDVGGGVSMPGTESVYALAAIDEDGDGPNPPVLYVAGDFTTAGSSDANFVARWNGSAWSALDSGLSNTSSGSTHVYALAAVDELGEGPTLYVGGLFTLAGPHNACRIAAWRPPGAPTVQILSQPESQTVDAGEPAEFSVVATGYDPLTYEWRRDGMILADDEHIYGATTPTLTIDPTTPGDEGLYVAVVSDACTVAASDDAALAVLPCPPLETAKLLASDGDVDARFGTATAISGDTAVIGAIWDDELMGQAGAVYVFGLEDDAWVEQVKLLASNGGPFQYFGYSTAISAGTVVVGSLHGHISGVESGAAYVFQEPPGGWDSVPSPLEESARLIFSEPDEDDNFGSSVSVSGDVIVAGASGDDDIGVDSGAAYVFRFDGSTWVEEAKLTASDGAAGDAFGSCVSIFEDTIVVAAFRTDAAGTDSGSAYVFRFNGGGWVEEVKLVASDGAEGDRFGGSAAIAGDTIVIGAHRADALGQNSGAAYVFEEPPGGWSAVPSPLNETAKLTASDGGGGDGFGGTVAISGDAAVIGAYGGSDFGALSGSAYVFRQDGPGWIEQAKLTASDGAAGDRFGTVAVSDDIAVIGASLDDDSGYNSGSAYVFELPPRGPAITDPPADQTVFVGEPASFSVTAEDPGPLGYQWRKDGVTLVDGGSVFGATAPTLTIDPVLPADAASYDVRVSNACRAVVSNAAMLTVIVLGDLGCDGVVSFFDIDPFVLAVTDAAAYEAAYPDCDIMAADCNGDGEVSFFDIDCFVALIVGGG